jgi:D-alanine-D-alanine ligase
VSIAAAKPLRVAVLYTSVFEALKEVREEIREDMDLEVNARLLAEVLGVCGHEAWPHAFGKDTAELVSAFGVMRPDAVFNLSECPFLSPEKEMHACALLELLRLPYTGNGPLTLGICNSKSLTKQILVANGIPTPPFRLYTAEPARDPDIPYPLVVKPANEDGSAGITEDSFVRDLEGLRRQVKWLKDGFRQDALAADPHRSLPPAELVYRNPRWRLCTYESKWDSTHPSYAEIAAVCPAEGAPEMLERLSRTALECARIFRLVGYARVDFRMDERGDLYVLEVNPNPDISPDAGMPRAARAAGIPYPELVGEILRLGIALGSR